MFRVAEYLATGLDQEFRRLTQDVTTDEKTNLAAVLRSYLKRRLASDMEQRIETPHAPMFGVAEPGKSHASVDLEWIEGELASARSELAGRLTTKYSGLIGCSQGAADSPRRTHFVNSSSSAELRRHFATKQPECSLIPKD